jgi:endonuclease YncB( thermonuclease family)
MTRNRPARIGWRLAVAVVTLALAAAAAAAAPTAPIDGVVTRVVDGDSLWLEPAGGGRAIEVRLAGIDAPERCQRGGAEARAHLAAWVLKRPARLRPAGGGFVRDRYGRVLGHLVVDGVDINRRLVERGQAWSLRSARGQGPYLAQERRARAQRLGLHAAGAAAELPHDFRRRHGPCQPAHPAVGGR